MKKYLNLILLIASIVFIKFFSEVIVSHLVETTKLKELLYILIKLILSLFILYLLKKHFRNYLGSLKTNLIFIGIISAGIFYVVLRSVFQGNTPEHILNDMESIVLFVVENTMVGVFEELYCRLLIFAFIFIYVFSQKKDSL